MKKYIIDFDVKAFRSFVPQDKKMQTELIKIMPKNVYYYMGNSMVNFITYAKLTDNIHTYYVPFRRYWRDIVNKRCSILEAYFYKRLKRKKLI